MRFLKKIVLILVLVLFAWWLLGKLDILPSMGELIVSKKVEIDQTPVVIQQIKPLAQLVTITAYTEVMADSSVKTSVGERLRDVFNPFSGGVQSTRELVVIGKVVVRAGVDLQKLTTKHIFISKDSVSLKLPPAEVLDVIINPSDTEIFLEEGKWDNAAIVNMKKEISHKAMAEITQRGVLYQAEERAREVLLNFFTAAGFKKINIVKSRLG